MDGFVTSMTHTTTTSNRRLVSASQRILSDASSHKSKLPGYLLENLSLVPLTSHASLPKYLQLLKPQNKVAETPASWVIPSVWNVKDKSQFLDISDGNLRISYQGIVIISKESGPGKSDMDAASVRANQPISAQTGLFYYEVEIISKGRDGYVGIGFCGPHVSLGRLPGWDDMSWGYHGDDGNSFACSGTGHPYGPTFTTGDVIGCILNFSNMSAAYTKNGLYLGIAFKDLLKDVKDKKQSVSNLYPLVGLRTPGEIVQVNFGQKPFKFDIENYFREERLKFWSQRMVPLPQASLPTDKTPMDAPDSQTIHSLILSHLVHSGFNETAQEFFRATLTDSDPNRSFEQLLGARSIQLRQQVRGLLMNGQLDPVFEVLQSSFPTLLSSHPKLHLSLCIQKFIELVRNSYGGANVSDMDIDGQEAESSGQDHLLQIIQYGRHIQAQFATVLADTPMSDALSVRFLCINSIRKKEVFSLMCYETPNQSMVSFLLDRDNWTHLSDALNAAILGKFLSCSLSGLEGLSEQSPLEKITVQVSATHKELLNQGVGAAAFVNIERDCFI